MSQSQHEIPPEHPPLPRNDYRSIRYYLDSKGRIWRGPFCPDDNLHYGIYDTDEKPDAPVIVSNSELPMDCVEVSPLQVAWHRYARNNQTPSTLC